MCQNTGSLLGLPKLRFLQNPPAYAAFIRLEVSGRSDVVSLLGRFYGCQIVFQGVGFTLHAHFSKLSYIFF